MATLEIPEHLKQDYIRHEAKKELEQALKYFRLGCARLGIESQHTTTEKRILKLIEQLNAYQDATTEPVTFSGD